MRIIAGEWKGRRLAAVKGRVRPTSARVREAIFNILGDLEGVSVLDLFAGTGALALEALSRGAKAAVLVEDHPAALQVLRRNLEKLGAGGRAQVLPLAVDKALKVLARQGKKFHLVLLDPPYGRGLAATTLTALEHADILAPGALVVAEHSSRETLAEHLQRLTLVQCRQYGDTRVSFYRMQDKIHAQESAADGQSGDLSGNL